MNEIKRTKYLDKLSALQDKHIIKVITGMRRTGKSVLLAQFAEQLRQAGVDESRIQRYNFEDITTVLDYRAIHDEISAKLIPNQMNYIFLDEIQNVPEFERMVDSLFVKENVDLYITGSNAYMLSGELATLLSGRYIELNVLPLSFREYLELSGQSASDGFDNYIYNGGMPQSVEMFKESEELGIEYLRGVFNTVLVKDVLTRDGVGDGEALNNLLKFLLDNVGSLTSPHKIAEYMKSNYRTIDQRKLEKMITAMAEAFILFPVNRSEIKGKELLATQQKYYLVDTGFRKIFLNLKDGTDMGHLIENMVYLELIRRGNQVWVGKTLNGKEIDFVARDIRGATTYYQVTETMLNSVTRDRELTALQAIDDHNSKIILTLDKGQASYDGIKQINLVEWLLS